MFKFKISFVLLCLLAVSAARAEKIQQDDPAWLGKMAAAARQTDYSGTFIYQSGSNVETSRITHVSEGGSEHEKLEGLDGERSEIIRKDRQIWCYLGERRVMVASGNGVRTFPSLVPEKLDLLQDNYLMQQADGGRVAGFRTRSILFKPRDKMRYAHKIWADLDSGLLLKSAVLDERGHIIEQYVFTELKIGGNIDRKWIVRGEATAQSNEAASSSQMGTKPLESGWQVYELPAGFAKVAEVSRHLRTSQSPVAQLIFSDGLAEISVFVEAQGDRQNIRQGLRGKGLVQVFSKVQGANLVTVVGEVPAHTVMQVAESVRYGGSTK